MTGGAQEAEAKTLLGSRCPNWDTNYEIPNGKHRR